MDDGTDDYYVEYDSDVSDVESVDSITAVGIQDLENQINEFKERGSLENINSAVNTIQAAANKNNATLSRENDNLLYDPDMDEKDAEWVKQERAKHSSRGESSGSKTNHKSDAMLSCPACMITVCIDCQRHDTYKNQFRAMFVMNCRTIMDEILRYEKKNKSKKRRKREGPGQLVRVENDCEKSEELNEFYHPVKCAQCDTEIAVYDQDEVYHFFNVLESLP